jgi:hypothetical protein
MQTEEDWVGSMTFAPPPVQWDALWRERDQVRLLLEVARSIVSYR